MTTRKQWAVKYGLGILAAIAALLLRKLLDPFLGTENPFHTAWLGVVFSAWYCGIGPAIATVVVTVSGICYWFLPPAHSFHVQSTAQLFGILGFLILSAVIIALGESTRRVIARRQQVEAELRVAYDELETRVQERTEVLAKRTATLEQRTAELAENAAMLDMANDAIFVRSAADKISYWNQGAERLYGWTKEETLGRSAHVILHTEFPIPLDDIKSRETWEGELRQNKRDGSQIIVASRWRTIRDDNGISLGWLEINTDITSRKQAEDAARSLSARILTLQDAERRRIARDLHDSLGQYLAALKMNVDYLTTTDGEHQRIAADCSEIVSKCLTETRTISHLLHPPMLDEAGLASAAGWYVDEFSRRSGITVSFAFPPERRRLDSDIEIALFRAIQEALTNVHRHSGASSVDIRMALDEKSVRLEIQDNGRGISQSQLNRLMTGTPRGGVGLAGMRERLRELGGSLKIQSGRTGTRIIVIAPLSSKPVMESDKVVA